jgi:polyhydroxyalkanoate synthesis regulator phasin
VSEGPPRAGEGGVADALRAAVERTLNATAGSAAQTRDRAGELLDEVTRRGREARGRLARRGQDASAEISRRGQEARDELGRRLEAMERRLASIEDALRSKPKAED